MRRSNLPAVATCVLLVTMGVIVVLFDDWQREINGSYTTLAGLGTRFVGYGLAAIGSIVGSALVMHRTRARRLPARRTDST
jgi:hypothetical protein